MTIYENFNTPILRKEAKWENKNYIHTSVVKFILYSSSLDGNSCYLLRMWLVLLYGSV